MKNNDDNDDDSIVSNFQIACSMLSDSARAMLSAVQRPRAFPRGPVTSTYTPTAAMEASCTQGTQIFNPTQGAPYSTDFHGVGQRGRRQHAKHGPSNKRKFLTSTPKPYNVSNANFYKIYHLLFCSVQFRVEETV